ncbi:MAG: S-layer homology domain-containing protein [Clostridia bacterium]|nr:S-layer homology domain-containing protein [Clostridia bacterium]
MKKIISTILAVAMLTSTGFAFEDIEGSVYEKEISELKQWNYLKDWGDVKFRPEITLSRADAAVILAKVLYPFESFAGISANPIFTDIDENHWAGKIITVLHANNIITGFEDGTFRPYDEITVAQLINMCVKMTGYSQYVEQTEGKWYEGVVKTASEYGFTEGITSDIEKPVTREQMAKLLHNTVNIPVVLVTGWIMSEDGMPIVQTAIADGNNGTEYRTLLSYNEDITPADALKILGKSKKDVLEVLNWDDDDLKAGNAGGFEERFNTVEPHTYLGIPVNIEFVFWNEKLFSVVYEFDKHTQEAYRFAEEALRVYNNNFGKHTDIKLNDTWGDNQSKKNMSSEAIWTEINEDWFRDAAWTKNAEEMDKNIEFVVAVNKSEINTAYGIEGIEPGEDMIGIVEIGMRFANKN